MRLLFNVIFVENVADVNVNWWEEEKTRRQRLREIAISQSMCLYKGHVLRWKQHVRRRTKCWKIICMKRILSGIKAIH